MLVSLVLNVALAVAVVTWLSSASNTKPRVVRAINPLMVNSNLIRIVKTNVLIRPRVFTWTEVESPDYAVYISNLRELGMPETTVRDIIVADIDQLFARRQRDQASQRDIEWWRSTASYAAQSNALAQSQELVLERAALLAKLLGTDWDKGRAEREASPLVLAGPVLGILPDEVKAAVQTVANQSRDKMRDYVARTQAAGEEPNPLQLARLREETRQQLAALLNPLQLEEFLLRYSENAGQLRQELAGFNASPEEFRTLFRSIDAIDREMQLRHSGDDAASQRNRENLGLQRLVAIRKTLGPDRFADYQTARDPAYREAVNLAQQAGAGENAALALVEINRATKDELDRIRNDPTLTEAQKQQQLRETEGQQKQARALVLGETPAPETAPEPAPAPAPPIYQPHLMLPGETLEQLAFRYGVRLGTLLEANPDLDIYRIRRGTVINIPPATQQPLLPQPGVRRIVP